MAETAAGTACATPANSPAAATRAGPGSGAWIAARRARCRRGFFARLRFAGLGPATGAGGGCAEMTAGGGDGLGDGAGAGVGAGSGCGSGAGSGWGTDGLCATVGGAAIAATTMQASNARALALHP
jgi:hypothetical protein